MAEDNASEESASAEEEEEDFVVNNTRCNCINSNGIETVRRGGQDVIIYTDGDGVEYEYPAAYGTACIGWDEILPPYCGDENNSPLPDQPAWCT